MSRKARINPKPVDTATVRALRALEDAQGRLTPEVVVEAASSSRSPLHKYFTWDDTEAAIKYRLDQARTLLRTVEYTVNVENRTVKAVAYLRDPDAGPRDQGYIATRALRTDPDASHRALVEIFGRIAAMLIRAQELATALNAEYHIDPILQSVCKVRRTIEDSLGGTAN